MIWYIFDALENERRDFSTFRIPLFNFSTFRLFDFSKFNMKPFHFSTFRNSFYVLSDWKRMFPTQDLGTGGALRRDMEACSKMRVYFIDLGLPGQNPVARVERGYPSTSETNPRAQARPLPQVLSWRSQIKIVVILTTFIEIGKSNRCWQQEEPILHSGEDQLFHHMK